MRRSSQRKDKNQEEYEKTEATERESFKDRMVCSVQMYLVP